MEAERWAAGERWGVRIAVGVTFVVAACIAIKLDPPDNLPSVALGKAGIYRLEVFLLVAYGALLTLTPLFHGVVRGRLPIEISARGAKWDEVSGGLKKTEDRIDKLERTVTRTAATTLRNRLQIERLKQQRE